jgi:hypothetical protein
MDKRLGLFLYQDDTTWVQNNEGFYYLNEVEYYLNEVEYSDRCFLYDDPDFNLAARNEFRLGPYEMVEW